MSAELLRRAAVKLREHAEKTPKAPWSASDDGLVWPDCLGDPVAGSQELENAEYVALLHPPVALALADWLTYMAERWDDPCPFDCIHGDRCGPRRHALTVARLILREAS